MNTMLLSLTSIVQSLRRLFAYPRPFAYLRQSLALIALNRHLLQNRTNPWDNTLERYFSLHHKDGCFVLNIILASYNVEILRWLLQ